MEGRFGVFDHAELLAEFGNDVDAEEYMTSLDGNYVPEYEDSLRVREVPDQYDALWRMLTALRRSRDRDRAVQQLHDAVWRTPHDA